jgi:phosphatidylserine/phosphatidylglycerophosphate/cardiolipin synthase-like enzyme
VDRYGEVLSLVQLLAAAHEAGVDVRVLLPRVYPTEASKTNGLDANGPAARLLASSGVPVRYYGEPSGRPWLHAKPALIDDLLIVGNGNWTPNCFRINGEMGLAVRSTELTADWARRFEHLWAEAHAAAPNDARSSPSARSSCACFANSSSFMGSSCVCAPSRNLSVDRAAIDVGRRRTASAKIRNRSRG